MRVINVIVIKRGAVYSIDSFGVFEEQLSSDVVGVAEKLFEKKALDISGETLEEFEDNRGPMESFVEDGIFMFNDLASSSVCLTWSELE